MTHGDQVPALDMLSAGEALELELAFTACVSADSPARRFSLS